VDGVGVLSHPHVLAHTLEHLAVPALPVLQRVEAADGEQHGRERRRVEARGGGRGREVGGLVGAVAAWWQERAPHPVGAVDGHDGRGAVQAELRGRPLLAAEEGLDGDQAGDADVPERGGVARVAAGHVVRDVAAGAVARDEAAGDVERDSGGGGRVVLGVVEEAQRRDPVVVGRREPVLRGTAVVDGEHGRGGVPRHAAARGVVGRGRRGEVREPAAVEEDDHGEGGRGLGRRSGRVEEARAEAAGAVQDDVPGGDAAARGGDGRDTRVQQRQRAAVQRAVCPAGGVGQAVHELEGEPHEARHRRLRLPRRRRGSLRHCTRGGGRRR